MEHLQSMNKMKIVPLAKLSLVGLVFIYASKLIDTLYHGFFSPAAFAGIVAVLTILAGIAQLCFFIALYKYFLTGTGKGMEHAGRLAITGSAIGLLPKLLALAVLSQHQSLFFFTRYGSQISALCLWLSAFCLLVFSSMVLLDSAIRQNAIFKRAFIAGQAGWAIMFAAHSLVLINYVHAGQLAWVADFLVYGPMIFIITSAIAFVCLFYFYKTFVKVDI